MNVINVQEPIVFYKKDRGFWFIECRVKVTSDAGGTSSSSSLRPRSYMPAWGNIRFNKRIDALQGASSWREFVVEALSTRESVAKHCGVAPSNAKTIVDNHHDDRHIIDLNAVEQNTTSIPSAQPHAMHNDGMQEPNLLTFIETKELDTSVADLGATEEEMHDFCASGTFLTRARVESNFGADDDANGGLEYDIDTDGGMDDEERCDYIATAMPLQEAELLAGILLEPSADANNHHRIVASSLPCDEGQRCPGSKRPRRDINSDFMSNWISTINQRSEKRNYEQEIDDLRLEVKNITRELTDARKIASENSRVAFRARQCLAKMLRKEARGARPSGAIPGSDTRNKWLRRHVDKVSNFFETTFGSSIFEIPISGVDGSARSDDDVDEGINMKFLGKLLAALTRKHTGLEPYFLDALAEQRGVNSYKQRLKKTEEITVDAVRTQLTSVAVLLLAHLHCIPCWLPDARECDLMGDCRWGHPSQSCSLSFGYTDVSLASAKKSNCTNTSHNLESWAQKFGERGSAHGLRKSAHRSASILSKERHYLLE